LNLPGLNAEQRKQLVYFLSNLTGSRQQKPTDPENIGAYMVGIITRSTTVYNSNAICYLSKLETGSWILDSGASDHMSSSVDGLHDIRLLENPILVSLPNGFKVQVTYHGNLKINDHIILDHALVVPHFKFNLLSVKRLAAQLHCQVIFTETLCTLQGSS